MDLAGILAAIGGPVRLSGLEPVEQFPSKIVAVEESLASPSTIDVEFSPNEIDFGRIRQGDSGVESVIVRTPGRGRIQGRVVSQPGWVKVSPQSFDRRKQKLSLTADTEHIFKPGEYDEELRLEIEDEPVSVPIHLTVLPRRRRFSEVWWWYLPLLVVNFLPIFSSTGRNASAASILVSIGLLSAMLFIVTISADLGIVERIAPAISAAVGLGATSGLLWKAFSGGSPSLLRGDAHIIIGSLLSLLVILQLLTASKWRLWAITHAICALGISAVLVM
jgi:hypothetical protein